MRLHVRFMENSRLYNWWHHLPLVSVVHFAAVIAVGSVLAVTIQNEATDQLLDDQVAQAVISTADGSQSLGSLTAELLRLSRSFDENAPTAASDLNKITQVVNQRKALLLAMAQNSPKAFLFNALPPGIFKQLPEEVQGLLEVETEVSGPLTVIHQDAPPKGGKEKTIYEVEGGSGTRYHVHPSDTAFEGLTTGAKVNAKGIKIDKEVVAYAGGSGTTVTSTGVTAPLSGPRKVLVILFNFTDNTSQPFTPADMAATMFTSANSVNTYFKESSFNNISFSGDVVGWYTIPYTSGGCDSMYSTWGAAAKQAAINAGVPVGNYQHIIYQWNNANGCSYGGMGTIGGSPSSAWLPLWYLTPTAISHEVGHNILAQHASLLSCAGGIVTSTCSFSEYGDPSDCMGSCWNNFFHFVGPRKLGENWLTSAHVQTVTGSGTFTVSGEESNDASIKMLKIPKANTADAYYVSLRQPTGFDGSISSAFTTGASVHLWNGNISTRTQLINGPLADGTSITDPTSGITISQISHTPTTVTVSVTMQGSSCVRTNPTVSLSPVSQGGPSGTSLTYSVSVKNNDSSSCTSSSLSLSSGVPNGWSGSVSPSSLSLTPGATGVGTLKVASASATDGTYAVSVGVSDASHSGSASASYVVLNPPPPPPPPPPSSGDTVGPTVSITSPANGTKLKGNGNVTISVTASDTSGVSMIQILLDGGIVKNCSSATLCSYTWSGKTIGNGNHTISAIAKDTLGNQNAVSITVVK